MPKTNKRGWRYWIRLLAVGLIWGFTLLNLGYIVLWVHSTSEPANKSICCLTPANMGFNYEEITLTTKDNFSLYGWYIPSRNGAAVILLHGYGGNRLEMLGRAGLLAAHGYGVLLYDERASGESEGDLRSYGWLDVGDVPSAIDFLVLQAGVGSQRIGILGFSIGGQIALRTAAKSPSLQAVVAEEPGFATYEDIPRFSGLGDRWIGMGYWFSFKGLEWRLGVPAPAGVVESLPGIPPRPVLFVASGSCDEASCLIVRHFYDLAGDPKIWWNVPEAGHGQIPFLRPQEYEDRIVDFFDAALLSQGK